jgi:hypothetical protein
LPQEIADQIEPFPVAEGSRYAPHFLSGWLCEEYAIGREEAAKISAREFKERERRDIEEFLPGDTFDDLSISTDFQDVTEDLILLPIWIFAYSYRGRIFRFVLNGSTGKSTGKKPISARRVALAILGALLLAGLIALIVALLKGGR